MLNRLSKEDRVPKRVLPRAGILAKPTAIGGQSKSLATLSQIPVLGQILFTQDPVVYGSYILVPLMWYFIYRTRPGLNLRAIGESPATADAMGVGVATRRYMYTLIGGALAGVGGAYLSLGYTPTWVEGMTAGRGWIALALVVFATWKPWRVLVGAYLFGSVTLAQFQAQAAGVAIASQMLAMLPYLATIVVLAIISRDATTIRLNAPASLGKSYHPE